MGIETKCKISVIVLSFIVVNLLGTCPSWAEGGGMGDSWKIKDGLIPDTLRSKMEEIARKESVFEAEGQPNPPWKEFPLLERYSIGWRMGAGEDYIIGFRKWFSELDEKRQSYYEYMHPEPNNWAGFYKGLKG